MKIRLISFTAQGAATASRLCEGLKRLRACPPRCGRQDFRETADMRERVEAVRFCDLKESGKSLSDRRNSTDLEDIFIAHIAAMDAMARALENAAALLEESPIRKMVAERYASFDSGLGKKFEDGLMSFEEAYEYGRQVGEPKLTSGKQELYEAIVNMYC